MRSRRQTAVADDPAPGESALDGAYPASAVCTRAPGGGAPSFSFPEERRYSTAAFSTACRAGDRPLTSPVALALRPLPGCRRPAFTGRRPKEQEPGPLPSRPRQSARLATAQDAFHRQVPSGTLSQFRGLRARHRADRLCHRSPASDALSPPELSRGGARPKVESAGSSPVVAMGRAPPVDFCNRVRSASTTVEPSEPRPPRLRSPACAAFLRALGLSIRARIWRVAVVPFGSQPTGMSRVRGRWRALARRIGSSLRDRSRRELCPSPIDPGTSCRKLATTPAGVAVVRGHLEDAIACSPGGPPLPRRFAFEGRLSCSPAKGSAIRRTRGAFHRRFTPKGGSFVVHSLSPACGLVNRRLFRLRARCSHDGLRGSRTRARAVTASP